MYRIYFVMSNLLQFYTKSSNNVYFIACDVHLSGRLATPRRIVEVFVVSSVIEKRKGEVLDVGPEIIDIGC